MNWEVKWTKQNATSKNATAFQISGLTESTDIDRSTYLYTYALLIVIVLYLVFQRAIALYLFCLKASRRIHQHLLQAVLRAKMHFFNTNSSGRIINRFAKDLYDVDYYLALVLYDLTLVSGIFTFRGLVFKDFSIF